AGRRVATEVAVLEPGDVHRELDAPVRAVDRAGHAEHDAVDELARDVARLEQRPYERRDRVERGVGGGHGELDVLARAQLAAHVADRAADEARAEVEP